MIKKKGTTRSKITSKRDLYLPSGGGGIPSLFRSSYGIGRLDFIKKTVRSIKGTAMMKETYIMILRNLTKKKREKKTYRGARNGRSHPPKRSWPDSFLPPRPHLYRRR
ncbi:hypothetical protein Droror1_Dr00027880 [Drosera rotundifolia]